MKANAKLSLIAAVGCSAGLAVADGIPQVSGVTMAQPEGARRVTIEYTLANAPAVVTMDIQTNVTGDVWASIGGEHIQRVSPASEVFRKVETNGKHAITWHPDQDWPEHAVGDGKCRAVVKAWALNNTPDYLVVDIAEGAKPNTAKYYPSVEFLPGGLLKNTDYRTNKMVLRKIVAKNVTYTMGSVMEAGRNGGAEATVSVTLTNNFYMAVFETTQAQYQLITRRIPDSGTAAIYAPSAFSYAPDAPMRPVENVSMEEIRWKGDKNFWPNPPHARSFLAMLREVTGIDNFEIPFESQWEYACRAGHGESTWGNGVAYTNQTTDAGLPGRYASNGGTFTGEKSAQTADYGTAIVGSYPPNDWGLYDMHGNVQEFCTDWYTANISAYGGRPNVDLEKTNGNGVVGQYDLSGTLRTGQSGKQVQLRGGYYEENARSCRAANRESTGCTATYKYDFNGFRVICTDGLD